MAKKKSKKFARTVYVTRQEEGTPDEWLQIDEKEADVGEMAAGTRVAVYRLEGVKTLKVEWSLE